MYMRLHITVIYEGFLWLIAYVYECVFNTIMKRKFTFRKNKSKRRNKDDDDDGGGGGVCGMYWKKHVYLKKAQNDFIECIKMMLLI